MKLLITIEIDGDRDDAELVQRAVMTGLTAHLSMAPFSTSLESVVVPSPHDLEEQPQGESA